jgi:hypothetical protein
MLESVVEIYTSNLGLGMVEITMIILFLFTLIFAVADFRIAVIVGTLMYASQFIILYELGDSNFYKPLMATLLAIVILILSLAVTSSKNNVMVY